MYQTPMVDTRTKVVEIQKPCLKTTASWVLSWSMTKISKFRKRFNRLVFCGVGKLNDDFKHAMDFGNHESATENCVSAYRTFIVFR